MEGSISSTALIIHRFPHCRNSIFEYYQYKISRSSYGPLPQSSVVLFPGNAFTPSVRIPVCSSESVPHSFL